jgi:hypothetical protein
MTEVKLAGYYALTIALALGVGCHLEDWINTRRKRHLFAIVAGSVMLCFFVSAL